MNERDFQKAMHPTLSLLLAAALCVYVVTGDRDPGVVIALAVWVVLLDWWLTKRNLDRGGLR